MAIVKWKNKDLYDPWNGLRTLQDEINELFDIDRTPSTPGLFDRNLAPSLDVIEGDQNFTVRCELPGIELKDMELTVISNVLTIKGEKKSGSDEKHRSFFKKECWTGTFQRTISLPDSADTGKIGAELKDGILTITLPKKEEAKPRQISVKIQ
ncbi:MAG: Hsp20/alpha crystallin family protein [Spirochaetales bacterium]|nr:Hsp20/alpha crystallin family protein [Spirochaetales bacterium]